MFEKYSNEKMAFNTKPAATKRDIYKEPPLISYRKGKSLKDMLVLSKTIKALINTMGTQRESCRSVNPILTCYSSVNSFMSPLICHFIQFEESTSVHEMSLFSNNNIAGPGVRPQEYFE